MSEPLEGEELLNAIAEYYIEIGLRDAQLRKLPVPITVDSRAIDPEKA